MPYQPFLSELGRRLRAARLRRALGVGAAAEAAGVSRRHLTEAEAGRANPSVLVLGRLADALGVPLRDLVDIPLRARERVALVGLRGAGKSTVGRALARALEVPFVEVDRRVEDLAGLSLAEIFDVHGQAAFHRFEAEALEQVLSEGERVVLAAGGSIIDSEENFRRLRETCTTIWLHATPEDHWARVIEQGDRRPMQDRPRAQEELRAILKDRAALYATCDRKVETSGRTVEEVVAEVLALCAAA
ncbi:MAG: helix-turn-helix domain-containing protein [Planctomycetota bacterium]|nr:helix-turn-helix domain-containing protein [Planctomycetota bacterium]